MECRLAAIMLKLKVLYKTTVNSNQKNALMQALFDTFLSSLPA
jgi:hypothetical protein